MREILFRGKRTHNDEWIYGSLHIEKFEKDDEFLCCEVCQCDVYPETVGQYTGLTDKNGKKIFEGDIVKYGDTIHKVVFEQRNKTAYFGLVYSPIETLPFGHYQDLKQIEVIANIHDTPELLKENEE